MLCNLLILLGTIFGALHLFLRRSPFAFPLAVYPVAFPLVYYITHTSLRLRHPADPILIILTAVALLSSAGGVALLKPADALMKRFKRGDSAAA
jgi:hypothetical protein